MRPRARAWERPRFLGGNRRVRTPTVLQMEAVECGAAALAMVLAHHGRVVPLDELRIACGVSRDGSKASNILSAARRYGLVARGYRLEPEELATLPLPAILHWNFNHFVVLEGVERRQARLNDPASGPRRVPQAELDRSFTGVALSFQPGPDFQAGGDRTGVVRALAGRLHASRAAVAYVVLAGVLLVLPGLVVPAFSRVFIDDVLVKGLHAWIPALIGLMTLTALLVGGLTWLQRWHLFRLEAKLAVTMSGAFFWHILRLPVRFFTQRYAGEIGARVAVNDRIAQLLSGDLATTALSVVMVAFYGVLMLEYDPMLAAVGVGNAVLNLAALKYAARRRGDLSRRLLRDQGKLMGMAMGGLQSIETLKAMGAESDFFAGWSGQQARAMEAQQQLKLQTDLLAVLPPLLLSTSTTLVLVVGGLRVMDGRLSMGMVVAFLALMTAFISPVNRLFDLGGTLQEVRGHLDRVEDVMRAAVDPAAEDQEAPPAALAGCTRLAGRVELCGVTFGYSPLAPPLIQDLDLTLRPGSRVALVGGSGSGKTTIARLVCGLYTPGSGDILFDGVPRQSVGHRLLTASFAVVDQEIFLFEGTVRDNICMWDATVPEADMIQAAMDARVHDEIMARPGGYGGRIEEGGRNLSGGQRQRLEIARALVNNPTILVLDEATSALDPITEKAIDDNLRRRGCTCLLVAHRLSTIRDCDEIVVLDAGKVVQRGSHDALKDVPGPYARLMATE